MKLDRIGTLTPSLVGLLCFMVADCSPLEYPSRTPRIEEQFRQELVEGRVVLDCGSPGCVAKFNEWKPGIRQAYSEGDWIGLGLIVAASGYQIDIGYFYLGVAAEGLGAFEAADKYFRVAGYIATRSRSIKCRSPPFNTCDGSKLPADIYPHLTRAASAIEAARQEAPHPTSVEPHNDVRTEQDAMVPTRVEPTKIEPEQPETPHTAPGQRSGIVTHRKPPVKRAVAIVQPPVPGRNFPVKREEDEWVRAPATTR